MLFAERLIAFALRAHWGMRQHILARSEKAFLCATETGKSGWA